MSRVRSVRLPASLCLAALLPFVAACGSDGGGVGGAADVVPGDVALYMSFDTDFDGDQWAAVEELAARFPDGENFLQTIVDDLESEEDIDFERDVEPALGPEAAVAVLELPPTELLAPQGDLDTPEEQVVVLLQPDDQAAFERLVAKSSDPLVTREIEGWQAVSDQEEWLDRFEAGLDDSRLGESDDFQEAMGDLDEGALVRFYASGEVLQAEAAVDPELGAFLGDGGVSAVGFAARAEDGGVRLDGTGVLTDDFAGTFSTDPYEPSLPEEVPGDVLAYFSSGNLEGVISGYRDMLAEAVPELETQLGMAEGVLGVSLEEDIAPLFSEEVAVYVRPAALVPELTLVTRVDGEEEAVGTVDSLVEGAAAFGAPVGSALRTEVDGIEVREVPLSPQSSMFYAAFDGLLVVTSSRDGIAELREDDGRLADEEAFREATDRAGLPDETEGFGYVDLGDALPLLLGFATLGNAAVGEADEYLDPLESLVFYGDEDGDTASFTVFLGID